MGHKHPDDMTLREFGELPADFYSVCQPGSGVSPKVFTKPGSGEVPEPKHFTYTGVSRECFGCGKMMIEDYPERPHNPLHANWLGATDWTSIGNWCSTKLDCMMDSNYRKAHIVICDECFEERKHRITLIEYTDEQKQKNKEDADRRLREFQEFLRNEFNKGRKPKN
jgi:hypothetical protein